MEKPGSQCCCKLRSEKGVDVQVDFSKLALYIYHPSLQSSISLFFQMFVQPLTDTWKFFNSTPDACVLCFFFFSPIIRTIWHIKTFILLARHKNEDGIGMRYTPKHLKYVVFPTSHLVFTRLSEWGHPQPMLPDDSGEESIRSTVHGWKLHG